MLQSTSQVKSYDRPLIEKAAAIIEKDPTDHLSADQLATKVGMSSAKLRAGFKKLLHTSINDYRLNLCLRMAQDLLSDTDMPIKEIARRTGFGSSRSFGRRFSDKFNQSPKEWRKRSVLTSNPEPVQPSRTNHLVIDYSLN